MPKIKLSDLIIFTFFFTVVVSFPFSRINAPLWVQYTLKVCIQAILLISYSLMIRKYKIPLWGNANKKCLILMIPLVVVVLLNIWTMPFASVIAFNQTAISSGVFFFELALSFLVPINEEIMFRLLIHSQLPIKNRILKVVTSAGIFALINLISIFFNGFNVQLLINVAYIFGLGLVLGFIYEYGESIITCVVFHIVYYFLNTVVFSVLYSVGFSNIYTQYYLPVGIVALIAVIYMALLYIFYLRKQDNNYYSW